MQYRPIGKRATAKRLRTNKQAAVIEDAVAAARFAIPGEGLCLPMCVLVNRLLGRALPSRPFFLRLGSLHVIPEDERSTPTFFDPGGPNGIDGGFHAWLEDRQGRLLDPSIHPTLGGSGYAIDPDNCFIDGGRSFVVDGLAFLYEELCELEVTGMPESEPHLARLEALALGGEPGPAGKIYLDVHWRGQEVARSIGL